MRPKGLSVSERGSWGYALRCDPCFLSLRAIKPEVLASFNAQGVANISWAFAKAAVVNRVLPKAQDPLHPEIRVQPYPYMERQPAVFSSSNLAISFSIDLREFLRV